MNLFNKIKFAAAVFDKNPEVQKLYKSGQLKFASEIDQPTKRPDVETMEAINAFMKRNPVEKAGGGMLVQPSIDGSRPGYASDYSPEERKQQRIYKVKDGKRTLDLTKEQKKWFNKTHKNNPNSRFYKKDWDDLGGKKADLLDSYFNELKREKPPKGYITTKEFSKKYGFPIYEKRQYGPVTKAESNYINNALMKKITAKDADKGRKNLFLQKFLKETLEPKQFDTVLDLGDGKKSVKKVNYVKDNAEIAKKVRTYVDSPSIDPKTIQNMNLVLSNNKIKTLFNRGDYKGIVKALGQIENLTNAEKANVMLRVAQAMSGVNFRDFKHNIKTNKISAKKIFKGLETGRAGIPTEYNDAYKRLKHNTIKDAIGLDYFTKSYQGFIDDARSALKKAGIDITNLDLNEITGLSSGYKNQTFSSTQFVNFMDTKFNQGAHASMIGEYSRYENALKTALKNGTVNFKNQTFTPRQLINNWQQWRSDWYDRLDDKYKTKAVRDILPTFTLGKDPYSSAISKKRLAELSGLGINLQEEGIKSGYAKTFSTIGKQPVLKEVVDMKPAQIKKIIASFGSGTCAVEFGKKGQRDGGRTGYKTGTVSLDDCFRSGVDNMNKGNYKTADQINDARGLLLKSKNLLRAVTKYGVLPELAFIGLESAGRTIMGDSVGDSIKKSIDTFTSIIPPLATDFTSGINKKEFDAAGGFGDMKLNVDKYRANFDKVQALKRDIQNLEAMNVGGEFGYMGSRDDEIAFKKAALKKAEQELLSSKLPEAQMKTISRMEANLADAKSAKSPLSKAALKDQMEGISTFGLGDYTGTDSGRMYPAERKVNLDKEMFPSFKKDIDNLKKAKATGLLNIDKEILSQRLDAEGVDADRKKEFLGYVDYFNNLDNMSLSDAAAMYGDEQVYGANAVFGEAIPGYNVREQRGIGNYAGGGIAGLSGGDKSGPAPESGPQSQGLQGLMNRVKNR